MKNIVTITAEGENLVVRNPKTGEVSKMTLMDISSIIRGLKYRNHCVGVLLASVDVRYPYSLSISPEAEELLKDYPWFTRKKK